MASERYIVLMASNGVDFFVFDTNYHEVVSTGGLSPDSATTLAKSLNERPE